MIDSTHTIPKKVRSWLGFSVCVCITAKTTYVQTHTYKIKYSLHFYSVHNSMQYKHAVAAS